MTNYSLRNNDNPQARQQGIWSAITQLWPMMRPERNRMILSLGLILLNSALTIWAPLLIGHTVDDALASHNYHDILVACGELLLIYLGILVTSFAQTRIMGGVGQRTLYRLRQTIFTKLQELPVAFFNANKAGDLISRINNDTDKLNQFFSQALMQFIGNVFVIFGAGFAMLWVNHRLGLASLVPALGLLIFMGLTTAWVKRANFGSLQSLGGLSAEIQESLSNFKVIIAFNRRDFFRTKFEEANQVNYNQALRAGIASNTYVPVFGWASNLGTLIVIVYGLHLISTGDLSFGLLISYLAYVNRFYDPLRQLATIWSTFQSALAGWDRIAEILSLESDLPILPATTKKQTDGPLMEFQNVSFGYQPESLVLKDLNFTLDKGKTYALVGPTGGGKTTTASLIARLFDPTSGTVIFEGQDLRTVDPTLRTQSIGFILQDPFIYPGTVRDNLVYGNSQLADSSTDDLTKTLQDEGLTDLLARFDQGLDTPVGTGDSLSLGQKQLIAFMRAVLRHPDLLVLDEATANIDTVTEQLLGKILDGLPSSTTKVVIAHRLNTIQNADEIFFVNSGTIELAGSLSHALEMLQQGARTS